MASPSFFHTNFMFRSQPLHEEEDTGNNNHNFRDSSIFSAGKRSASFSGNNADAEEDVSDDCSQQGEKKRKLNAEQVRTLEKSFEQGNKLEPERKMQLAISLGLPPRQIAIWFQNRRARWKTKQLEKDYDLLKLQFQSIDAENNALHTQNKKLQAQILALKNRDAAGLFNLNKETEVSCSNRSEDSSYRQFLPAMRLLSSSVSDLHCSKIENVIADEQFSNFLYGMEDQTAFWPWPDHNNHH